MTPGAWQILKLFRSLFKSVGQAVGREARFLRETGLRYGDWKGHARGSAFTLTWAATVCARTADRTAAAVQHQHFPRSSLGAWSGAQCSEELFNARCCLREQVELPTRSLARLLDAATGQLQETPGEDPYLSAQSATQQPSEPVTKLAPAQGR